MGGGMLELVFKPLNYLAIKWEVEGYFSKRTCDITIPLILSVIVSIGLMLLDIFIPSQIDKQVNIFKSDISGLLAGFLQTIPGFYIAALAAIATLTSPTMDRDMDGVPPTQKVDAIDIDGNPGTKDEPLNRREFLSRLFSYLSFVSLILYFLILIFMYTYKLDIFPTTKFIYSLIYFLCLTLFNFLLIQLMFLTFLGLYYLGQRVHEN